MHEMNTVLLKNGFPWSYISTKRNWGKLQKSQSRQPAPGPIIESWPPEYEAVSQPPIVSGTQQGFPFLNVASPLPNESCSAPQFDAGSNGGLYHKTHRTVDVKKSPLIRCLKQLHESSHAAKVYASRFVPHCFLN